MITQGVYFEYNDEHPKFHNTNSIIRSEWRNVVHVVFLKLLLLGLNQINSYY